MSAKCRGMEDALFPEPAEQRRVRMLCADCPVRLECLAEALDNRIDVSSRDAEPAFHTRRSATM